MRPIKWYHRAGFQIAFFAFLWILCLESLSLFLSHRFLQREMEPFSKTLSALSLSPSEKNILLQRWHNFESELFFSLFLFSAALSLLTALGVAAVHYFLVGRPLQHLIALNKNSIHDTKVYSKIKPLTGEISELFQSRTQMLSNLLEYESSLKKNLAHTQKELVQAMQLCSVGELTASVLHDINNPLTAIVLNLSLLKEDLQNKDFQKASERLKRMELATDRIQSLTQRMLNFARKDVEMLENVHLQQVIQNALEFVEMKLQKRNIHVSLQLPKKPLLCYGNPVALEQVFTNLFTNAMDAMEKSEKKEISITAQEEGEKIKISVQDTGCGIPQEKLPLVFEAFYTTKPPGKGTGLGLSIIKQMIQMHKGEIQVFSEVGKGTRFDIWLWKREPKQQKEKTAQAA